LHERDPMLWVNEGGDEGGEGGRGKQRKGGFVLHEREPRLGERQRRELGSKCVCASTIEWFTHECFSRVSTDTQPSFPLCTPF